MKKKLIGLLLIIIVIVLIIVFIFNLFVERESIDLKVLEASEDYNGSGYAKYQFYNIKESVNKIVTTRYYTDGDILRTVFEIDLEDDRVTSVIEKNYYKNNFEAINGYFKSKNLYDNLSFKDNYTLSYMEGYVGQTREEISYYFIDSFDRSKYNILLHE